MNVVLVALDAKYIHSNLAIRYLEAYYKKNYTKINEIDSANNGDLHDISNGDISNDNISINHIDHKQHEKQHSMQVKIIKREFTINQHIDDIVASLYEDKADLIGFSCYIWNIEMILKIATNLKKVAPQTKVFLGGPEVSYDSVSYLEQYPAVDYVICGEGEKAFAELVEYTMEQLKFQNKQPIHLNNQFVALLPDTISYRLPRHNVIDDGDASQFSDIVAATRQGRIDNLADIPSPYTYDFDAEAYKHRIIYYESSRGCPYSCQYCLSSIDRGVRFFPLEQVKKDLLMFIEAEVKQVKFVDRTFNCAPKYALEIFEWIIKHNRGKTNFHFEISADLLSDKLIDFLKDAPLGVFQFEIGVQSTNEKTLETIMRQTNLQKLKDNVLKIKAGNNIHQHLDLIVGLPHEDYRSFGRSFDDVYALGPDKLQMGFLKILKGSGMHNQADEHGFIYTSEAPYEIMQTNVLSYAEIIKLKEIEHVLDHYYNSHQFDYTVAYLLNKYKMRPFEFYEQFALFCKESGFFVRAHSQAAMYHNLYQFALNLRKLHRGELDTNKLNRCGLDANKLNMCRLDANRLNVSGKNTDALNIEGQNIIDDEIAREILKFDFIRLSPHGKIPYFMESLVTDDFKIKKQEFLLNPDNIAQYFPQYTGLNMRNLSKKVHIELFRVRLFNVKGELIEESADEMTKELAVYLFVYHDDPLQFRRADFYDVTDKFEN